MTDMTQMLMHGLVISGEQMRNVKLHIWSPPWCYSTTLHPVPLLQHRSPVRCKIYLDCIHELILCSTLYELLPYVYIWIMLIKVHSSSLLIFLATTVVIWVQEHKPRRFFYLRAHLVFLALSYAVCLLLFISVGKLHVLNKGAFRSFRFRLAATIIAPTVLTNLPFYDAHPFIIFRLSPKFKSVLDGEKYVTQEATGTNTIQSQRTDCCMLH